jgi:Aminoglycoside 3-N-acetyltransferase
MARWAPLLSGPSIPTRLETIAFSMQSKVNRNWGSSLNASANCQVQCVAFILPTARLSWDPAPETSRPNTIGTRRRWAFTQPYRKLASLGGKILLLGASLEYLTSSHDRGRDYTPFHSSSTSLGGNASVSLLPNEMNLLYARVHRTETARLRQCVKMEPHLPAAGVMIKGAVGEGDAIVLDAKGLHEALHRLCQQGITMYTPKEARKWKPMLCIVQRSHIRTRRQGAWHAKGVRVRR